MTKSDASTLTTDELSDVWSRMPLPQKQALVRDLGLKINPRHIRTDAGALLAPRVRKLRGTRAARVHDLLESYMARPDAANGGDGAEPRQPTVDQIVAGGGPRPVKESVVHAAPVATVSEQSEDMPLSRTTFLPVQHVLARIGIDREQGDVAYWRSLLLLGEVLTKLTVLSLVASIDPERDIHDARYALEYEVVRANGIGAWSAEMQSLLVAPLAKTLRPSGLGLFTDLTQKFGEDSDQWQREALRELRRASDSISGDTLPREGRLALSTFFARFAALRNKTFGHGADSSAALQAGLPHLNRALMILVDNLGYLRWPWLFAHKSTAGRVTWAPISEVSSRPEIPSTDQGVYIWQDGALVAVSLLVTDADMQDFFLPNGDPKADRKIYEALSYSSGRRRWAPMSGHLRAPIRLPGSETDGRELLQALGNTLTNLPDPVADYVRRLELEDELRAVLLDERHPVIAIGGPGGIGKTSLALTVLTDLADDEHFDAILWFSARDVDLKTHGPVAVSAKVQSLEQIATQFCRLLESGEDCTTAGDRHVERFCESLGTSGNGRTLYVFDNFETVHQPAELYRILNSYIRLPNKILITTRYRDFKGEYALDVGGMSRPEYDDLVATTASRLNISGLLNAASTWLSSLYEESGGHPYVVKVALGEVAKRRSVGAKFERIMASRADILDALFDRSFTRLSEGGRRTFLTLCRWRAVTPLTALEAVALRPGRQRIDVEAAIDELQSSSLVQITYAPEDGEAFVAVPVAAQRYGSGRLKLVDDHEEFDEDGRYLHLFGPAPDVKRAVGFAPHLRRFFANCRDAQAVSAEMLPTIVEMSEFLARKHPEAWKHLAELSTSRLIEPKRAREAWESYLSRRPDDGDAWISFSDVRRVAKDGVGELRALANAAEAEDAHYDAIEKVLRNLVDRVDSGELRIDGRSQRESATRFVRAWTPRAAQATLRDHVNLARLAEKAGALDEAARWAGRGVRKWPKDARLRELNARL